MKKTFTISFTLFVLTASTAFGQVPKLIERNGRHPLLVDGKPFLILGGQAHNSSGWPAMLPSV